MIGKRDRSRHSSFVAMLDFLFNLVLAFATLVILLLMIIKAENAKPGVENKNEFIITVQWDDSTNDDVDTWVMDPLGRVISFKQREQPGMFLQRDDVGRANKRLLAAVSSTEPPKELASNMEVVNLTSWLPGQYTINLHMYRPQSPDGDVTVKVKVIKVNPFSEVATQTVVLPRRDVGAEVTVLNFTVDQEGKVAGVSHLPIPMVYNTPSGGNDPDYNPTPATTR